MDRRNFITHLSLAATTAVAVSPLAAQATPSVLSAEKTSFKLNYAPHFGMFENSAGKDLLDQLKFMADNGFMALEDNGMMGRDAATQTKIGDTMTQLGMKWVFLSSVLTAGPRKRPSLRAKKNGGINL